MMFISEMNLLRTCSHLHPAPSHWPGGGIVSFDAHLSESLTLFTCSLSFCSGDETNKPSANLTKVKWGFFSFFFFLRGYILVLWWWILEDQNPCYVPYDKQQRPQHDKGDKRVPVGWIMDTFSFYFNGKLISYSHHVYSFCIWKIKS